MIIQITANNTPKEVRKCFKPGDYICATCDAHDFHHIYTIIEYIMPERAAILIDCVHPSFLDTLETAGYMVHDTEDGVILIGMEEDPFFEYEVEKWLS